MDKQAEKKEVSIQINRVNQELMAERLETNPSATRLNELTDSAAIKVIVEPWIIDYIS